MNPPARSTVGMAGDEKSSSPVIAPGSWLDSALRHIQYGISIIRRDGWRYFFRRLAQLTSQQVKFVFNKATFPKDSHVLVVDEIRPFSRTLQVLDIAALLQELPQSKAGSDYPIKPGYHHELVELGISTHNQYLEERVSLRRQGQAEYSGKRVAFVSPIRVLGGGANLIFLAARAMQHMGVEAQILNLRVHQRWFEQNHPHLDLPVTYADIDEIPERVQGFDAVIATSNPTVSWVAPAALKSPSLAFGYYIQDYEPYFYPQGSLEYRRAGASYTLVPHLIRMVTTPWISGQIQVHQRVTSTLIGAHMDSDLFLPRPRSQPSWPERPLRIAAMIRPSTPRRNPKMTMSILQQASMMYGSKLEFWLFGCDRTDPGFAGLDQDFPWLLAGELYPAQVASLLNDADIFVDYSEFQAFGLAALESMATGLAVIVPVEGGTSVYTKDEENSLVVDPDDQQSCFYALQRLVEDDALRQKLQANAVTTAARFFPEQPAFNMLKALFTENR